MNLTYHILLISRIISSLFIATDRHKRIANAIRKVYPRTVQGICLFHMQLNLEKYGEVLVGLFKKTTYNYRRNNVKWYMKQIKELNINAWENFKKAGIKRWSQAYCPVCRYEMMTSNAAESLKSRLLWAKKLPICSIFEFARYLLQT